ncbi:MAG: hypothetical protein JW953_11335 [Anaerolineae bacterium]|nr:hypothetical protein [Anaerolineae bacterium]
MNKYYILFLSLAIVALTGLAAVLAQPVVPAEAGSRAIPPYQAGDDVGIQGTMDYLGIAGRVFVPESSTTVFAGQNGGGTAVTGGPQFMHAPVILPQGARIHGIRFYYYDNHATGVITARLYRNNGDNTRTELVQVDSPAGAVAGTHYTSEYVDAATPEPVDNSQYNYEIEVYWNTATTELHLMGIRVYFEHPD